MEKSGKIASAALQKSLKRIQVGVSALELDKIAGEVIHQLGGEWSYKTVPGYHFATCITFNEQVVHGLPTQRVIKAGDLVSIDLAAMYQGWHTDTAWTVLVGKDPEKEQFLNIGKAALIAGILQAVDGNKIGDISSAIQETIEGAGFHIVKSLVGHGVGQKLHEDPEVPGYGARGTGKVLKKGMTLAIEVIYAKGTSEVVRGDDRWTISSADNSWSGLFEVSIVVGKRDAKLLTPAPDMDWTKSLKTLQKTITHSGLTERA